jgi:hypothetical protein
LHNRFFVFGKDDNWGVYDRDDSSRRIMYTHQEAAQRKVSDLACLDSDSTSWCGIEHLDYHGPWADPSEFADEYTEAIRILGEDYFA